MSLITLINLESLSTLTLSGTVATAAVLLLDRLFSRTTQARSRLWWWLCIPFAYLLLPITVPLLPPPPTALPPPTPPLVSLAEALGLPPPSVSAGAEALPLLLKLWGAGAAASLLYILIATVRTSLHWRGERFSTNPRLLALLEDCRAIAQVSTPVALVVSSRLPSPALLGWIRPRLLLPEAIAQGAPDEQLRAIILHELSHLKTLDIVARWPFLVASTVHWFNPVAHYATRRWMHAQEEAADERAMQWLKASALPGEPAPDTVYLEALLTAARTASLSSSTKPFGALCLIETSIQKRIMKITQPATAQPRLLSTLAIAALLFGSVTFRPSYGEEAAAAHAGDSAKAPAVAAMQAWLSLIDKGEYGKSWDESSAFFKANVTRDFWISSLKSVRTPLGKVKERELASALHQQEVPQKDGTMKKVDAVIAQFDAAFENLNAARETVTFERAQDGAWRASGYYIKPM